MELWETVPHETPLEISGLIPRYIQSRVELNVAEAANIHKVVLRYLAARPSRRQAPFNLSWAYKLHRQMFQDVWQWAGRRRNRDLNIGVPHALVDTSLLDLLTDLHYWREKESMPILEQAARLHHRSVQIHPFENGNGRWARMLANIWLLQMRQPLTRWPDQAIGGASPIRAEYITAVKAADDHNIAPLLTLHQRYSDLG